MKIEKRWIILNARKTNENVKTVDARASNFYIL